MNKKIVYIAHPISGDIEANLKDLYRILRIINTNSHKKLYKQYRSNTGMLDMFYDFSDIIPCAPYIGDILALDDNKPEERKRGIENDTALIKSGIFEELWLTGSRISFGMSEEVKLFVSLRKTIKDYIGNI